METTIKPKKVNTAPVNYKELLVSEPSVDSRKVSGYLAVFGVKDSDKDILIKGCFAKSLRERGPDSQTNRKIAFLWQHKMDEPIGRFTVLKEDDYGLYFEAEVDYIELGERALTQLKSGTLNQMSFGFSYVWDKLEYDEPLDAFIVKEVIMYEGSVVTLGCNEHTYFAGMKGEQKEQFETELLKETEALIKSLPHEQQYKTRQLISKHIALASSQPHKPLREEPKPPVFDVIAAIKQTNFFNT